MNGVTEGRKSRFYDPSGDSRQTSRLTVRPSGWGGFCLNLPAPTPSRTSGRPLATPSAHPTVLVVPIPQSGPGAPFQVCPDFFFLFSFIHYSRATYLDHGEGMYNPFPVRCPRSGGSLQAPLLPSAHIFFLQIFPCPGNVWCAPRRLQKKKDKREASETKERPKESVKEYR